MSTPITQHVELKGKCSSASSFINHKALMCFCPSFTVLAIHKHGYFLISTLCIWYLYVIHLEYIDIINGMVKWILQVAFPSLELLNILGLDNVEKIWHNQLLEDSFSQLKEIRVASCGKLLNIFPSSMLNKLQSL